MTIAALKRHLHQAVHQLQQNPPVIGRPEAMARAVKALEAHYGAGAEGGGSSDRVHNGLMELQQRGIDAARTHLRYICWGLTEPFPHEPLLRRPEFSGFLGVIEQAFAGAELSLNPWRGLLNGYFTASPTDVDGEGRGNWLQLRTFLASTLPELRKRAKFRPPWLETLADHDNLLTDCPCNRYARILVNGDTGRLDRLKEELGIPAHSWFWRDAVLAQVRGACDLPDAAFRAALDSVLAALHDYPALANESLVLLLTRYHRGFAETPYEGLQDYAVKHWGSPNIFAQAKWAQVAPEVKAMIQSWLVRDDLKTFFEVLQEDRTADERRFTFWLRYHRQMNFVRIALGSHAWYSNHPDFKDMRDRRRDRVCRLDGGPGNNNAIIMKLGGHFFVEFSHTGNAAYGYAEHKMDFPLDRQEIQRRALSNQATNSFRESHIDKTKETWERKFERMLAGMGIYPDPDQKPLTRLAHPRPSLPPTAAAARAAPASPPSSNSSIDMSRLLAFSRRVGVKVDDRRDKGGAIWVRYLGEGDTIARELKSMGFFFSRGIGYWRK